MGHILSIFILKVCFNEKQLYRTIIGKVATKLKLRHYNVYIKID